MTDTVIDPKEHETLKAELERFKVKHGESEKHLKEQEKLAKENRLAAEEAVAEAARKSGDVEALETSWRQKLEDSERLGKESVGKYQQTIAKLTTGAAASALAGKLALKGSEAVLLPHIANRLSVDTSGEEPIIRVLDVNGKPSAMSVADLEAEIAGNAAFAPLLLGSKASGAGTLGDKGNLGAKTISRADFDTRTPAEQNTLIADGVLPKD